MYACTKPSTATLAGHKNDDSSVITVARHVADRPSFVSAMRVAGVLNNPFRKHLSKRRAALPIVGSTGETIMKKARGGQESVLAHQDEAEADAKRPRLHADHDDCCMEMDEAAPTTNPGRSSIGTTAAAPRQRDTILQEMVTAGNYTQDEIIQFCIDSGIPLSRMLELDLMRLNTNNNNNRAAK
jgi:hypothetical protein